MGVVTVSSSAARTTPLGVGAGFSAGSSPALRRRPASIVAFKSPDPDTVKTLSKSNKQSSRTKSVSVESAAAAPSSAAVAADLNYSDVAEALENIYKLSPAEFSDIEEDNSDRCRRGCRRKMGKEGEEGGEGMGLRGIVRNHKRRVRRLSLDNRIALRQQKEGKVVAAEGARRRKWEMEEGREETEVDRLLREYSVSTDLVSLDWRKMKIPPVLSSVEHKWLFKLMQPMKAMLIVKKDLHKDLGRKPTDAELAEAVNTSATKLKRQIEVGRAARNKIIKVRQEIQRVKLELAVELQRLPTDNEIIERVRISPERYYDVMKASKPVHSLNARHAATQEEFIDGITDVDGVGGDKRRHSALVRLAIDDVLDSLKPKESLVIRQRYGLDGKGTRTLGEIAGNLNASREMVRKHELKALMKLKHPARLDYLRRYI